MLLVFYEDKAQNLVEHYTLTEEATTLYKVSKGKHCTC